MHTLKQISVRSFLAASVAIAICSIADAAKAASFMGLGYLSSNDFFNFSEASGISADGSTVVGSSTTSSGSTQAFRWNASQGMQGLGYLSSTGLFGDSRAKNISADAKTIIGTSRNANGIPEAFRWTESQGMQGLGILPTTSFFVSSNANGLSADGSIIVGSSTDQAFRWTESQGMQSLGFPTNAYASGISPDGSTIIGIINSEAFRWTESQGIQNLGFLPTTDLTLRNSRPENISADASTIVGSSFVFNSLLGNYVNEAFRWTESQGMQGLGFLSGSGITSSTAQAASADGSVIVGISGEAMLSQDQAFIWKSSTQKMESLQSVLTQAGVDLTGWTLRRATAISDDGLTISGYGTNPDGLGEAWIAKLDSAPQSIPTPAMLPGLIGMGIGAIRKRRKQQSQLNHTQS